MNGSERRHPFAHHMRARRVGGYVAGLDQDFEWPDAAIGSPGVVKCRPHQGRVQNELPRGLCSSHVETADKQDVTATIKVGEIGDSTEGAMPGSVVMVGIDQLL